MRISRDRSNPEYRSRRSPEVRNLARRCASPLVLVRTLWFVARRVLFSLRYRFSRPTWGYPRSVRRLLVRLPARPPAGAQVRSRGGAHRSPVRLRLAVGTRTYEGAPDWGEQFDDPEQTMSLHRWHWLLTEERPAAAGIALMRSWLAAMGAVPDGVGGTPYTTSERIVNALAFLSAKREVVPDDLRSALLQMAHHVARHIEYHGAMATGNHVVNNARALYAVGQSLGIPALSDLARAVLGDALPRLITGDGFLREESSHYHLLSTRWLLELCTLAVETRDNAMRALVGPWAQRCAERSWFFLVPGSDGAWQTPLIGDVSPDCTPDWLIAYLIPKLVPWIVERGDGMRAYPQSGWFRLDRGPLTMLWHVPRDDMVHRATHGHADLGSFVLFRNVTPVIVDPGRPTYRVGDPRYAESGSARAHSTLMVDGIGPMVYDRGRRFPPWYQRWDSRVEWGEEGGAFVLAISHSGFHRIAGDRITHTRRFRVTSEAMEVEDTLDGQREHGVEAWFHAAPGDRLIVTCSDSGAAVREVPRWVSPAYGVQVPSRSFVVHRSVTLPYTLRCALHWERSV